MPVAFRKAASLVGERHQAEAGSTVLLKAETGDWAPLH